jgi:hypothetical protein
MLGFTSQARFIRHADTHRRPRFPSAALVVIQPAWRGNGLRRRR